MGPVTKVSIPESCLWKSCRDRQKIWKSLNHCDPLIIFSKEFSKISEGVLGNPTSLLRHRITGSDHYPPHEKIPFLGSGSGREIKSIAPSADPDFHHENTFSPSEIDTYRMSFPVAV
jgi:hypothetical protein